MTTASSESSQDTTTSSAPNPPVELAVSEITKTTARLTWTLPEELKTRAHHYSVLVKETGLNKDNFIAEDYVINGLSPGKEFTVELQAKTFDGDVYRGSISFTTSGAPGDPLIEVLDLRDTHFKINWRDAYTGAEPLLFTLSLNGESVGTTIGWEYSYFFVSLEPGTTYKVGIEASYRADDDREWSEEIEVTTLAASGQR